MDSNSPPVSIDRKTATSVHRTVPGQLGPDRLPSKTPTQKEPGERWNCPRSDGQRPTVFQDSQRNPHKLPPLLPPLGTPLSESGTSDPGKIALYL